MGINIIIREKGKPTDDIFYSHLRVKKLDYFHFGHLFESFWNYIISTRVFKADNPSITAGELLKYLTMRISYEEFDEWQVWCDRCHNENRKRSIKQHTEYSTSISCVKFSWTNLICEIIK